MYLSLKYKNIQYKNINEMYLTNLVKIPVFDLNFNLNSFEWWRHAINVRKCLINWARGTATFIFTGTTLHFLVRQKPSRF